MCQKNNFLSIYFPCGFLILTVSAIKNGILIVNIEENVQVGWPPDRKAMNFVQVVVFSISYESLLKLHSHMDKQEKRDI